MLIFKAISLIGKASTVVWVAKTGYTAYQAGSNAYKAYKKVDNVKTGAKSIAEEVRKVLNKK
jgi:hypothetical protein